MLSKNAMRACNVVTVDEFTSDRDHDISHLRFLGAALSLKADYLGQEANVTTVKIRFANSYQNYCTQTNLFYRAMLRSAIAQLFPRILEIRCFLNSTRFNSAKASPASFLGQSLRRLLGRSLSDAASCDIRFANNANCGSSRTNEQ
jgi:hypothetical protein